MLEQPEIPSWVPAAAADRIIALWEAFPDKDSRERLERLATYPLMRTHVWALLPEPKHGLEGRVIKAAFTYSRSDVVSCALAENPFAYGGPPPLSKYGPPVGLGLDRIAEYADALYSMAARAKPYVSELWPIEWPNCNPMSYDQMLQTLWNIADFFDDHHSDWLDWRASLPRIRKRNSASASQFFFAPMIALALEEIYDWRPSVTVVNALTEVVFDLSEGLATDTTRSRLRAHKVRSRNEAISR